MSVIRTAIIGFGTAGRVFHAPLVAADPHYALSAIVTGSPERERAARHSYPQTDILADTDALFARAGGQQFQGPQRGGLQRRAPHRA
ncbi:hypothetical protein ACLMMR_39475, partial [Streptomyces sp. NPDC000405]